MDPQQPVLDYHQLMGALRRFCDEKRTGTMFITTAENHAARFVLRQGEITFLAFRSKRGPDALPFLQKISRGRFAFSSEVLEQGETAALPPTRDLLALLAGEDRAPAAPARPSPSIDTARLERAQRVIEPLLAEFLGPIAGVICREYLLKASSLSQANDLRDVIEAISKEIRDPVKEARFKQQVMARLER